MRNPAIGDRVVTNNLEWGVIESLDTGPSDPVPWFNVRLDNGRIEMQDASRMSRSHPFGDKDPLKSCAQCDPHPQYPNGHPGHGCDYCPAMITHEQAESTGLCRSCQEAN